MPELRVCQEHLETTARMAGTGTQDATVCRGDLDTEATEELQEPVAGTETTETGEKREHQTFRRELQETQDTPDEATLEGTEPEVTEVCLEPQDLPENPETS